MAVPKGKRSKQKCKQRQLVVFYDKLDGVFKTRKEYFYRSLYETPYFPRDAYKSESVSLSINRPFRFPGFWPGRPAYSARLYNITNHHLFATSDRSLLRLFIGGNGVEVKEAA